LSVLEKDLDPDVKIGIPLPMNHIDGSGFFPGTSTTLSQTSSNIRNLLLTNKGERLGQPEFGCGLLQILFEPMSDSLLEDVKSTIEEAIAQWLPHVLVSNLNVERGEENPNQLIIEIEFSLTIQPDVHDSVSLNFDIGNY
tara:strand:- start:2659 stop:3078 length:420 start_codon:yes stop_codon:yes gene_type:complete